jgi:hypothetical protein
MKTTGPLHPGPMNHPFRCRVGDQFRRSDPVPSPLDRRNLYYRREPETPKRKAKTVPGNIERHVFAETRLTAYRLRAAA